jgi:death on curing protein
MSTNYLTTEAILELHDEVLNETGGASGVRDLNGLESAIAQPQSSFGGEEFYPTVWDKAGAYLFHICQAHAFVDGNKRTALLACLLFLEINGFEIDPTLEDKIFEMVVKVATGEVGKEEISLEIRNLHIESLGKK